LYSEWANSEELGPGKKPIKMIFCYLFPESKKSFIGYNFLRKTFEKKMFLIFGTRIKK